MLLRTCLTSDTRTYTAMKFPSVFLAWLVALSCYVALILPSPTKAIETQNQTLATPLGTRSFNNPHDTLFPVYPNTFYPGCRLKKPTAKLWKEYLPNIKVFVDANFRLFNESKTLDGDSVNSFPMYLRDKYASTLAPNELACDTVGDCSIGNCNNIDSHFTVQVRSFQCKVSAICIFNRRDFSYAPQGAV
jgi:hypothetical protein